jgi:hypothetical protein
MAQNYVGSNNINLLAPNGQFGTRLMGGSDSASARYIHTELMPIARALVKKEDDAILTYMDDDGLFVEPETYYPVIPLILVNGALGIGTGFSTNILPHNPKDLVSSLKKPVQEIIGRADVIRTLKPLARSAASGMIDGKIALSLVASSKSRTATELRVSKVANRVAGGELWRGVNTARVFVPEAPERMGVAIMV